jgi:hypothetical protein
MKLVKPEILSTTGIYNDTTLFILKICFLNKNDLDTKSMFYVNKEAKVVEIYESG